MTPYYQSELGVLYCGDCLEVMPSLEAGSVDSIVTDPPYGLSFMGKKWDHGVPGVPFWKEALRVAKPGAHLLAFGGTRTFHRLAIAIEDAGWEIRDTVMWVYGSGFPKSLDIGKAIDKAAGVEREVVGPNRWSGRRIEGSGPKNGDNCYGQYEIPPGETAPATEAARKWDGWHTALKPAWEPVIVARKPLDGTVAENVLKYGTGGVNVDGCRVGSGEQIATHYMTGGGSGHTTGRFNKQYTPGDAGEQNTHTKGRFPANLILTYPEDEYDVDGNLLPNPGRDEVLAGFPETTSGGSNGNRKLGPYTTNRTWSVSNTPGISTTGGIPADTGSAARFFYCASHEKEDLLFCRARAILSAWKLTKGEHSCSRENASVVGSSLCLSRQAAGSVLSDAAIAASRGDRLLSDMRGLSTTVTESECETLCETLITAMLISESVALPAPSQDALIQNGCRVSIAATQKPTDTTTITISLPTSGGYAEPVTFDIMPSSVVHGAKDSNASRFRYCAKSSKKDRDEGLEGRRNGHNTVKPTDLMRYLCRLVTPPGGIVIDPFMGSGSTGKAAMREGFRFIGIEISEEYCEISAKRIDAEARQGRLFT